MLDALVYAPLLESTPLGESNALLSACGFSLQLPGSFYSSGGTMVASEDLDIAAKHLDCRQGTFIGNRMRITAEQTIESRGSTFVGNEALQLHAGHDLHSRTETLTATVEAQSAGWSINSSCTTLGPRAGFYVLAPGAQLSVSADRDLTLTTTRVLNAGVDGQTRFTAGRDLTLGAVQVGEQQHIIGYHHTMDRGHRRDIGSQLKTVGDIDFQAGRHFNATAAQVTSGIQLNHLGVPRLPQENPQAIAAPSSEESLLGADSTVDTTALPPDATGSLRIRAGNNINIRAGQASYSDEHHWRGSHRSATGHEALAQEAQLAVKSSQGTLEITAKQDVNLTAAHISHSGTGGKTVIRAGGDITLEALQDQHQERHNMTRLGLIWPCHYYDRHHTQSQGSSRDVGSQLKTVGDIDFQAGRNFNSTAAQITSGIQVNNPGAPSLRQERDPAMTAPSSSEESLLPAESLATSSVDPQRATGSLRIQAGNNIDIRAGQASHHQESHWGGSRRATAGQEVLTQEAQLAVESLQGELQLGAQQDVRLSAVQLRHRGAAGHTTLTAGRHLTLDTLRSEEQQSRVQDADNFLHQSRTTAVGSSIQTVGDVHCQAGERLQATAAEVSSRDGAVQVTATQQLELLSGEATEDYDHATKRTKRSFFSSKTIRTRDIRHQSMALGSSFSGRQVTMIAGNQVIKTGQGHLSLQGSSVVSDRQTTLVADTVSITSAENRQQQHYTRQVKKSGLFSTGGASFCIGSQRQSLEQQRAGITHNSSSVGSLQGDVTIQALEHYQQLAIVEIL